MPVAKKRATAAPAKAARPTIAGLKAEITRLHIELSKAGNEQSALRADLRQCQSRLAVAEESQTLLYRDSKRLTAQRDASWAHLGRLWEATGGEQGDRKAETREELLDWAVDDAITLLERGKAAEAQAREWREKYEKAAESLAMAEENMRLNQDEYERVCNLVRQHERERAACWGCRLTAWWRGLRG